jgi:hypothetical protein
MGPACPAHRLHCAGHMPTLRLTSVLALLPYRSTALVVVLSGAPVHWAPVACLVSCVAVGACCCCCTTPGTAPLSTYAEWLNTLLKNSHLSQPNFLVRSRCGSGSSAVPLLACGQETCTLVCRHCLGVTWACAPCATHGRITWCHMGIGCPVLTAAMHEDATPSCHTAAVCRRLWRLILAV